MVVSSGEVALDPVSGYGGDNDLSWMMLDLLDEVAGVDDVGKFGS